MGESWAQICDNSEGKAEDTSVRLLKVNFIKGELCFHHCYAPQPLAHSGQSVHICQMLIMSFRNYNWLQQNAEKEWLSYSSQRSFRSGVEAPQIFSRTQAPLLFHHSSLARGWYLGSWDVCSTSSSTSMFPAGRGSSFNRSSPKSPLCDFSWYLISQDFVMVPSHVQWRQRNVIF